jgi:hypothetical protein
MRPMGRRRAFVVCAAMLFIEGKHERPVAGSMALRVFPDGETFTGQ